MYHSRFKGNHYEAGFKWGSLLYKNGVEIKGSPTFEITKEKKEFAKECLKEYEKYYPEILEEIKGISDGQNSSFELFTQIIFSIYCFEPNNHCTCFAFKDGKNIIFGRNSDFLVSLEKLYMNCLYKLDGAYSFNGNTTAFVQMEDGVNEWGLAVGLTFVYPHIRKPGLNAGMILRYLLEKCKTTKEAIKEIEKLPIASAQTFTIADKSGDMVVIECNPKKVVVIRPKQGENFVATANNFNSPELKEFKNPGIDDWRSKDRYETAYNALKNNASLYSVDFAKRLLAGEYGFMCQYNRKEGADTVWSVVYDLTNDVIYRVEGNPSRKKFKIDERKV